MRISVDSASIYEDIVPFEWMHEGPWKVRGRRVHTFPLVTPHDTARSSMSSLSCSLKGPSFLVIEDCADVGLAFIIRSFSPLNWLNRALARSVISSGDSSDSGACRDLDPSFLTTGQVIQIYGPVVVVFGGRRLRNSSTVSFNCLAPWTPSSLLYRTSGTILPLTTGDATG